jgi:hypothetical protein
MSVVTLSLSAVAPAKLSRKFRKALTSRRWEKKLCKFLSVHAGYEITHIARRIP